jgi:ELWxxDGT repeat protein
MDGVMYVAAQDGVHGAELWRTDGTAAGTWMVADINPGSNSSSPVGLGSAPNRDGMESYGRYQMVVVNHVLYFRADDGVHGPELWRSDGTATGTYMVKDINPGPAGSNLTQGAMVAVGNTLYFSANDGVHGDELWKSDGTAAGTVMVKDIRSGSSSGIDLSSRFQTVNGVVVFSANDGVSGDELWKSDGTAAGTTILKDLNPGSGSSSPVSLAVVPNVSGSETMYFSAATGKHNTPFQLWKTDGTAAGTTVVGSNLSFVGIQPRGNSANGLFYFAAQKSYSSSGSQFELWRSDGTSAGTVQLTGTSGPTNIAPQNLFAAYGQLFFSGQTAAAGREIWTSDGTVAGTYMFQDINPGAASSSPYFQQNVNGTLLIRADDGVHGVEPWRVDQSVMLSRQAAGTPTAQLIGNGFAPGPVTSLTSTPAQNTNRAITGRRNMTVNMTLPLQSAARITPPVGSTTGLHNHRLSFDIVALSSDEFDFAFVG